MISSINSGNDKKKHHVLHLIDTLEMGGAQKILYQLAVKASNDFKVTVAAWCHPGPYVDMLREKGIAVEVFMMKRRSILLLPLFIFDSIRIVARLSMYVRKNSIDIIHSQLPESHILAVLVSAITGCKAVVTVQNNNIMPFNRSAPVRNRLRKSAMNFFFSKADMVLAVGNDVKKNVEKDMNYSGNLKIVYNAIDYDRFTVTYDTQQLKKNLGLSKKSKVILCIGRLVPQKGQNYLIDAASRLIGRYPTLKILLLGDGPLEAELKAKTEALRLGKNINFLGLRSDVPELLSLCDIFILPSIYEGLPLVVLEAMAASRPVIATNVEGTRELVSDGVEGLLVSPKSADHLAEAIDNLLSNPDAAQAMGNNGRKKVYNTFRLEQMVASTEAIYSSLMEGK